MFKIEAKGSFSNLEKFLTSVDNGQYLKTLEKYGRMGVQALSQATPVASGETANSWRYEISKAKGSYTISWFNNAMAGSVPVVILLQYGHGTGTGGYVQGRDFINPAIQPIFDQMADEAWKAVTSA